MKFLSYPTIFIKTPKIAHLKNFYGHFSTFVYLEPDLYTTEDIKDPLCHIKLFTPDSNWTWYIIEISKEDNNTCFGYVIGHEAELGYFNLSEIEAVRGSLGLVVERDTSFTPTPLSEVKRGN